MVHPELLQHAKSFLPCAEEHSADPEGIHEAHHSIVCLGLDQQYCIPTEQVEYLLSGNSEAHEYFVRKTTIEWEFWKMNIRNAEDREAWAGGSANTCTAESGKTVYTLEEIDKHLRV